MNYAKWKNWEAGSFGGFTPLQARYFHDELAHAGFDARQAQDILEFGYGNGNFIGWARSEGHRVTGIETLPEALERARVAGIAAVRSISDLQSESRYDLIVAFDVFEHIPRTELESLLRALRDRLKPDGRILARFPNGGSPFGLYYQNGDLTHVTALAFGAVTQLAESAGLKLQYCGAPQIPLRGVGAMRATRRAMQITIRLAIESAVRHIYFDGLPVCLAPNIVAVMQNSAAGT